MIFARIYSKKKFAGVLDITPSNLNRVKAGENFVTSETPDKILKNLNK